MRAKVTWTGRPAGRGDQESQPRMLGMEGPFTTCLQVLRLWSWLTVLVLAPQPRDADANLEDPEPPNKSSTSCLASRQTQETWMKAQWQQWRHLKAPRPLRHHLRHRQK